MISNIQDLFNFIFNESYFMIECTSHPSGKRTRIKSLLTIRARVRTNVNPPFAFLWFQEAVFSYMVMQTHGWQANAPGLVVIFWANDLDVLSSNHGKTKTPFFYYLFVSLISFFLINFGILFNQSKQLLLSWFFAHYLFIMPILWIYKNIKKIFYFHIYPKIQNPIPFHFYPCTSYTF